MSERRTLNIGVAINLGNYESLRLEVSDEVETEEDAAELAAYLSRVLSGYGSGDAATRAAIDKYRTRVLDQHKAKEEEIPPEVPEVEIAVQEEPSEITTEPTTIAEPLAEPLRIQTPEPKLRISGPAEPEEVSEPLAEFHAEPLAEPHQIQTPTVTSAENQNSFVCEKCGAAVSKVQRDVSNLFMGKTLCKSCMK